MALRYAANQPQSASEARMWQAQLERQQQTAPVVGGGGAEGLCDNPVVEARAIANF